MVAPTCFGPDCLRVNNHHTGFIFHISIRYTCPITPTYPFLLHPTLLQRNTRITPPHTPTKYHQTRFYPIHKKRLIYTENQQTMTAFRHITNTIHTSLSNHYTTPVDQTSLLIFFQVWTPESGTHYCTPEDGHTNARNMLRQ
jgi:hypothetical protein